MIKLADGNDKAVCDFCRRDVFGTRISAYYGCYGMNYSFVSFWTQTDGEKITAVIGKVDSDITLCADCNADCDELRQFADIIGFASLQCSAELADKLGFEPSVSGYVVQYKGEYLSNAEIKLKQGFELKEIYSIIKAAQLVGVGDYLPWLSDSSFRVGRGVTRFLLAEENGKNAGTAAVLFQTESASLLGAVATVPEFRGRGIAGALVTRLAHGEVEAGRRTELLCKKDGIVDFYKSIGFEVTGEWSLITR